MQPHPLITDKHCNNIPPRPKGRGGKAVAENREPQTNLDEAKRRRRKEKEKQRKKDQKNKK
jgi:hypothetical protein